MKRLSLAVLFLVALVLISKAFAYPILNSFLTLWPLTAGGNLNDVYSGGLITNLGATGAQTLNLQRAIPGLHITVSLAADTYRRHVDRRNRTIERRVRRAPRDAPIVAMGHVMVCLADSTHPTRFSP
jgi:hypothetical protein